MWTEEWTQNRLIRKARRNSSSAEGVVYADNDPQGLCQQYMVIHESRGLPILLMIDPGHEWSTLLTTQMLTTFSDGALAKGDLTQWPVDYKILGHPDEYKTTATQLMISGSNSVFRSFPSPRLFCLLGALLLLRSNVPDEYRNL